MSESYSASYAAAGVDIEAGYEGVRLMKAHVARTVIDGVVSGIGGFGGLFAPDLAGMERDVAAMFGQGGTVPGDSDLFELAGRCKKELLPNK